jgi:hypothetical protein
MHNIFIYNIITLLYYIYIIENLMWSFVIYLIKSLIKNSATNHTLFNINIRYLTLLILGTMHVRSLTSSISKCSMFSTYAMDIDC